MSELAPIALFVFNRPEHVRNTVESLLRNPEFLQSPFYVFCDGARHEREAGRVQAVREFVRQIPHPRLIVVEAERNQGLAKSITTGVGRLCREHGRAIVLEDDLVVSPALLAYFNAALQRYEHKSEVMQISGHMFPVEFPGDGDAVFMPMTTSWGWATWERAWNHMGEDRGLALTQLKGVRWRFRFDLGGAYPYARMLMGRLQGKNNSWAIWWHFQVFMRGGLALFPRVSLVNNDGFDGSGTHCGDSGFEKTGLDGSGVAQLPEVVVDKQAFAAVRHYLSASRGFKRRLFDVLWRLFYRVGLN